MRSPGAPDGRVGDGVDAIRGAAWGGEGGKSGGPPSICVCKTVEVATLPPFSSLCPRDMRGAGVCWRPLATQRPPVPHRSRASLARATPTPRESSTPPPTDTLAAAAAANLAALQSEQFDARKTAAACRLRAVRLDAKAAALADGAARAVAAGDDDTARLLLRQKAAVLLASGEAARRAAANEALADALGRRVGAARLRWEAAREGR